MDTGKERRFYWRLTIISLVILVLIVFLRFLSYETITNSEQPIKEIAIQTLGFTTGVFTLPLIGTIVGASNLFKEKKQAYRLSGIVLLSMSTVLFILDQVFVNELDASGLRTIGLNIVIIPSLLAYAITSIILLSRSFNIDTKA